MRGSDLNQDPCLNFRHGKLILSVGFWLLILFIPIPGYLFISILIPIPEVLRLTTSPEKLFHYFIYLKTIIFDVGHIVTI